MKNENWILCRKPLAEKTIADNVLKFGVGGINIDGSRIGNDIIKSNGYYNLDNNLVTKINARKTKEQFNGEIHEGRFPANFIYCGDDDVIEEFAKAGYSKSVALPIKTYDIKNNLALNTSKAGTIRSNHINDEGTPSRFFFDTKE